MFGFPINLQSNDIQKFTNNADSGFPKIQQREIFYSIKNGNWNDLTIWQTASGRVGKFPTANDDVYIRNVVTLTGVANITVNYFCNNLFISGTLGYTSIGGNNTINLYVNGNIRSLGIIDLRISSVSAILTLLGTDNYILNLVTNSTGTVTYGRFGDQDILDLPYSNLTITGTGVKKPTNHLLVSNTLSIGNFSLGLGGIIDLWWWDLTVLGNTNISVVGTNSIRKSYFGNILFVGDVNFTNQNFGCDFSVGNPNIEFRGGFRIGNSNPNFGAIRTGTGIWSFTTNNQTINANNANFPQTLDCTMIIGSGVTLTNNGGFNLTSTINGTDGTSRLVQGVGVSGIAPFLNFATLASVPSMTIGTFDFTTNANTIQYFGNYSATIPSYFTIFRSLTIAGTGTKTLGVNTTINTGLNVTLNGTFDLGIYNIDVIGATTIDTANLIKTGSGNVLFRGSLILSNSRTPKLNFSGGNPTVELRGGISYGNGADPINSGTGQWSFTTSNQEIRHISGLGPTVTLNCPILIASGITVTAISTFPFTSILQLNNSTNGADASSRLTSSNNNIYITNASFPQPMTTGVFDITTNANVLGYAFNGNYTIPYTAFSNLHVVATGTKSLSGNTTLSAGLFISSLGVLECLTYNLTVIGGASTAGSTSTLSKNGAGSIVLGGLSANINFSGNPTVEIKGNMSVGNQNVFNTGTGQWTFSTINSSITNVVGNLYTPTFNCPILVSGITLTIASNFIPQTFIFTGLLDGSDVASTFRMGTGTPTVNYRNATQPMATGVLDTSTNLNTWIYGLNNQDIKGSPTISPKQVYRNLTLNGTGVKTLQGYVSVLNTYTLTAPATLANNGFTLTNP